jgi:hypothetical protein
MANRAKGLRQLITSLVLEIMTEKRVNEKAKKHFSGHQLTTSILVNE